MDPLDDLLLEWEDRRDRGEPVSPTSLCPADPALAAVLTERIHLLQAFDDLARDTPRVVPGPAGLADPGDPERVGKYEVRGVLGRGGMGVVYHGWDPHLRRPVAIKMIRSPLHPADARFEREGHALAQLKHPNVVAVYEAGTHAGDPYLAMEYVPGGSLADHHRRLSAAGPVAVARLVGKVARAVQFAHERGILHRDLKPGNVLLGPADEPLVADFGLAKLCDSDPGLPARADAETVADGRQVTLTDTTQPGTPAYMAPEQFDPTLGPVGPATDVWALGVILYELATGGRPFAGTDHPELARQVRESVDYSAFQGRTADRLASIIARCLQVRPEQRYRSAGELADDLARLARPRRRWMLAAAVAAGVLLAAAGLAVLVDWPELRYQSNVTAIQRDLGQHRVVQLVGPNANRTPTYRLREGGEATHVRRTPDGLHIESNTDCSLLEFAALRLNAAYVIRARFHLVRAFNEKATMGVYVGHQTQVVGGRRHHAYTLAGFNEHLGSDPNRTDTWVMLEQHYFSRPPAGSDLPLIDHSVQIDTNARAKHLICDVPDRGEVIVTVHGANVGVTLMPPVSGVPVVLRPLGPSDRRLCRETIREKFNAPFDCDPGDPICIGIFIRQISCLVTRLEVETVTQE
jgi:hypothetical protein